MSRSPTDQSNATEKDAYAQAWSALQKLLLQGKSESGQERNCLFLNLGASADTSRERFATVSAATSVDFPDDARGLALCDWDHDGRVDMWITNRTAPRARLMLNRYQNAGTHWISLRLQGNGKSVNRDAVGARIEVYLPGEKTPRLRTVAAGNGFLSQSSAWQHVGLGKASKVEKIVVRWPGGTAETFNGATVDAFFDLKQGNPLAIPWKNPDAIKPMAVKSPKPPPSEPDTARLVLLSALPVPENFVPAPVGTKGLLLNLWSSECPNCLAELEGWSKSVNSWTTEGVAVASWCVDAERPAAEKVAKSQGFSHPILVSGKEVAGPTPELLGMLNALQKSCYGLQQDMPVPTSFLFDANRRLVAIYKGPVDASQIKADFSLLSATAEERLRAACPDPTGRWHAPIQSVGILSSVSLLLEEGFKEAAEKLTETTILYYNQPLPADAPLDQVAWHRQEFASGQKLLAMWDLERKDYAKAEKRYLISLQALPTLATRRDLAKLYSGLKDPKLYPLLEAQLEEITKTDPNPEELAKLGVLKLEMGKPTEAIALLKSSLEKKPEAINWFQLAQAHRATGAAADARKAWENALKLQPEFLPALNNLAWLLATHPDKSLRDGTTAQKLAKKAVELTSGKHPAILATLAAAQAETGDFAAAQKTANQGKLAAEAAKDTPWAEKLSKLTEQFTKKQPVRE